MVHAMSDSPEAAFVPVEEARSEIGPLGDEGQRLVDVVVKAARQGAGLLQPGEGPYAEDVNCQDEREPDSRPLGDGQATELGGCCSHAVSLATVRAGRYLVACEPRHVVAPVMRLVDFIRAAKRYCQPELF